MVTFREEYSRANSMLCIDSNVVEKVRSQTRDKGFSVERAASKYEKKRYVLRWASIAAAFAVVVFAALFLSQPQSQHLQFNEITSVTYSAPLHGTSVSEPISYEEGTAILGFDITSLMPSSMRAYDFSYAKMLSKEGGDIIGLFVEAYVDSSVYQSPGIFLVITFGGNKPDIDYSFVNNEASTVIINGIQVQACFVPEHSKTTDSGVVKNTPAQYVASFDSPSGFYYFESRGTLSESEFAAVILSIVEYLGK